MGTSRTRRFHMLRGPESLFQHAPAVLRQWTVEGVDISGGHVQQRLAERKIDEAWFTDFDPEQWQVVTCDVLQKQKSMGYITARRPIDDERKRWLWAVFVHEHLVTAWVRKNAGIQKIAPDTVTEGPVWEAVRKRYEQELARAAQKAEQAPQLAWPARTGGIPLPAPPRAHAEPMPEAPQSRTRRLLTVVHQWVKKILDMMGRKHG